MVSSSILLTLGSALLVQNIDAYPSFATCEPSNWVAGQDGMMDVDIIAEGGINCVLEGVPETVPACSSFSFTFKYPGQIGVKLGVSAGTIVGGKTNDDEKCFDGFNPNAEEKTVEMVAPSSGEINIYALCSAGKSSLLAAEEKIVTVEGVCGETTNTTAPVNTTVPANTTAPTTLQPTFPVESSGSNMQSFALSVLASGVVAILTLM